MNKETQMIVDKLDFFRDAIVHHDEYKTQDLIHWLAVAGDMIEELAGVNEQLAGMEIMLTCAQSAAETWERKYKEVLSKLETTTRERDAAIEQVKTLGDCQGCKHDELCKDLFTDCSDCENLQCPCHSCNADGRNNWEWRGVKEDNK